MLLTALPNSLSPTQCTVLIVPGIMLQELLNYNPGAWPWDAVLLCALLLREKREPFKGSCEAVSTLTATAWASGFTHCLGMAWLLMPKFPGVTPEIGSCLTNPDLSFVAKQWGTSPLWGQTDSGDGAVTVNTGWELASALQSLKSISLERMWRQASLCWETLPRIVCPQRTSDSCAVTVSQVSWSWRDLTKHRLYPTECLH